MLQDPREQYLKQLLQYLGWTGIDEILAMKIVLTGIISSASKVNRSDTAVAAPLSRTITFLKTVSSTTKPNDTNTEPFESSTMK